MPHCQICGHENESTAKFCGHCGRDLSGEPSGISRVGSTILGRYTIRRQIAVGGMGVVYEAEQLLGEHSRTVAIKMLLPELSHDRTVLSRFTRECSVVAELSHQNTVRVYDFGTADDGTLYIAMEFVRGVSLAKVIGQGALSVGRALNIVEQMCHALHEAHELGIVHRDLKPDNVILTQHGAQQDFVKILDFGIAVRLSVGGQHETKLTRQGMILGTPPYMSPEQFTGAPVTRQSDIYSIGIILYEALTGHLPFDADNPWMWAQRHLTATVPDLPASLPRAIVTTVRSALAKDPMERPSTTLELIKGLRGEGPIDSPRMPQMTSSILAPSSETPSRTQPDTKALNAETNDIPHQASDTTARGSTAVTEPGATPVAGYAGTLPKSPGAGNWIGESIVGVPQGNSRSMRRLKSRSPGKAILITFLALGLIGFGVWIAYWYDLIESPFDSDAPPLPSAATAQGTIDTSAAASNGTNNDLPSELARPMPTAAAIQTPTVSVGASHNANKPSTPVKSTSSSSDSPTQPSSQATAATGGVAWPPNWPTLPSNLPSLPSSVPPLPSAIMGIPLPPIFQNAPANSASNAPAPQPAASLH
jgi:eukaryotic-like serine/threonine-protein kinase